MEKIPFSSAIKIRVVRTQDEFSALRESWNNLAENAVFTNVFTTWEWSFIWWKWYGDAKLHGSLYILVAETADAIVGIFPLYRYKGKIPFFYPKNQLYFIGYGELPSLEYLGPIIRKDWVQPVCDAAVCFLRENPADWNSLFFEAFAEDDPGSCCFAEQMKSLYPHYSQQSGVRFYVPLSGVGSYDEYLQTLSGHNRGKKRNRMNQAKNKFHATWKDGTVEDFDQWYPILVSLTENSRQRRNENPLFAQPHYSQFQQELLKALLPIRHASVYYVYYDNEPAAVLYSYLFQGKCYAYQPGVNSSMFGSPGDVIFQSMIMKTIEEKYTEFDFLRGGEWYKSQFTETGRKTEQLTLFSSKNIAYYFALWLKRVYRPLRHQTKLALLRVLDLFRSENKNKPEEQGKEKSPSDTPSQKQE